MEKLRRSFVFKKRSFGDLFFFIALLLITSAGLATMNSFGFGEDMGYFSKQVIFLLISIPVFLFFYKIKIDILKRTDVLVGLIILFTVLFVLLLFFGEAVNGAKSWFSFGAFSFQPADVMKIVLILILSKYLSRRHIAIKDIKHIFITGIYFFVPFLLVFLQPDFGSAMIFFLIWIGMLLIVGISWKHLLVLGLLLLASFLLLWFFIFQPYQKKRISSFLQPTADIQGAGYNAYQSIVAVGSGKITGKGLGYGSQSRLSFLPEHQTDFIFASFAEEWGFVGVMILLLCFAVIIGWLLTTARWSESNFETLFLVGLAIMIVSHLLINIGMNIGILPVTGITLPFMSYGGSHLVSEAIALGIAFNIKKNRYRLSSRGGIDDELVLN